MPTFRVAWFIDVDADTPRDAASVAFGMMQRPGTSANVFDVLEASRDNGPHSFADFAETIDLDQPELVRADQIRLGDVVDFEGDQYADPKDSDHFYGWEFENAVITEIERETPDCIMLGGDAFAFGFPPDHLIKRLRTDFDLQRQLTTD